MNFYQKTAAFLFPFWAGLISAISFLEAWLKFRADGVTKEIGLSIGSLVFTVLNRIELVILIILWIFITFALQKQVFKPTVQNVLFWLLSVILIMQTFWLLPELLQRADQVIAGNTPSNSSLHLLFILFEAIKLILLITLSIKIFVTSEESASKL